MQTKQTPAEILQSQADYAVMLQRAAAAVQVSLPLVCGWCGAVLSEGVGEVSHGICIPCKERVLHEMLTEESCGV